MMHYGFASKNEPRIGKTLRITNAQLGLLTTERNQADAAKPGTEAANLGEDASANSHIRANRVSNRGVGLGQSRVCTAQKQIKRLRKPRRGLTFPMRKNPTPRPGYLGIRQRLRQTIQPRFIGEGIIVEKGDDVTEG